METLKMLIQQEGINLSGKWAVIVCDLTVNKGGFYPC